MQFSGRNLQCSSVLYWIFSRFYKKVLFEEEKSLIRPHWAFQCLKGAYRKEGDQLFTQADSDRKGPVVLKQARRD